MQNLWKDDRPGREETEGISALASNETTPPSSNSEAKTNQNPGIGSDGSFQAASTSRAPVEAEISKPPVDVAGDQSDFKSSKSCQVCDTSASMASFDHQDSPSSQRGLFKRSYIRSFSFQEDFLDSDMPDVSC